MSEQVVMVTDVQRAAARARIKIDLAHGRRTPEAVVKIANAKPAIASHNNGSASKS